jgi:cation transporter-like permease
MEHAHSLGSVSRQRRRSDIPESTMSVILVFIIFFVIGNSVAFLVGAAVEQFSSAAGMLVFLALFIVSAITSWYAAVYITERFIVRRTSENPGN